MSVCIYTFGTIADANIATRNAKTKFLQIKKAAVRPLNLFSISG